MLFVIVALVGLTATSCSTEKKINKRLEGDWNVVSYDGVATAAGESEVYSFVKTEKTSGTGVYTATGSGLSFTLPSLRNLRDLNTCLCLCEWISFYKNFVNNKGILNSS